MSKTKFLIGTILLVMFIVFILPYKPVLAEAPFEPVTQLEGKDYYLSLVDKYAIEYNVSADKMKKVIDCENREWNPNLQSKIIDSRGQREKSFGLSQIHLPSHPEISLEEATNPEFSIMFMAQEFAKGRQSKWTCARKLGVT